MTSGFRTVLCPTDLSPDGDRALDVAYRLVAPGGTVHRLHVLEPVHDAAGRSEEDEARRQLRRRERVADGSGTRTQDHVVRAADVAGTIDQVARSHGADVIVMGSRGRTGLNRLFLGSVSCDVLKRTGLPVILVRTGDEAAAPRA